MEPGRIRAAVFVDFDNVFSGLLDLDPKAALAFAQEPQAWLKRLAAVSALESRRSYLVRRCYMNPAGWRAHPALGSERVFFSRYRPFFTKAGFEVIDCPSLTHRHKNAADIRICLDVIDTLSAGTRYDEYVIASGDSDFTPLLQRLRAADRSVTVIASSQTAVAYESVADLFLDDQEVIELMVGGSTSDEPGLPFGETATADVTPTNGREVSVAVGDAPDAGMTTLRASVQTALGSSSAPIHLAGLGEEIRSAMGSMVDDSHWFGHGTLSKAVRALDLPGVVVAGHHVWVDGRDAPPHLEGQARPALPELVERICKVADVPRLDDVMWPRVFDTLAAYSTSHEFKLGECTRWVRDELGAAGVDVGRAGIGFVVRGAMYGGCPLNRVPPPSAIEVASAFLDNTVKRAGAAGLHLTPAEIRDFRDWIHRDISDDHLEPG